MTKQSDEKRNLAIEWIKREKLIAILRGLSPERCFETAQALYNGGVRILEIAYNQKSPESWGDTASVIKQLSCAFKDKMLIGAGTVTTPYLAELTFENGGAFTVSPDTDSEVIKRSRELGLVSVPGALTPSEIKLAHNCGGDFIKVFPAGVMGADYFKAIKVPFNHLSLLAVAGMNEDNISDFKAAGADGFGISGKFCCKEWIEAGEFDKITEYAKAIVKAIKE